MSKTDIMSELLNTRVVAEPNDEGNANPFDQLSKGFMYPTIYNTVKRTLFKGTKSLPYRTWTFPNKKVNCIFQDIS